MAQQWQPPSYAKKTEEVWKPPVYAKPVIIPEPPIEESPIEKVEEPTQEESYGKGLLRRFLSGPSEEELGGVKLLGTPESEGSILPKLRQPETYTGGFLNSLYEDFVRPLGSPSGALGSSMPARMPPNVRATARAPMEAPRVISEGPSPMVEDLSLRQPRTAPRASEMPPKAVSRLVIPEVVETELGGALRRSDEAVAASKEAGEPWKGVRKIKETITPKKQEVDIITGKPKITGQWRTNRPKIKESSLDKGLEWGDEYTPGVLRNAGHGQPGLSTNPITSPITDKIDPKLKFIVYRDTKGNPIAAARIIQDADGVWMVEDFAADKTKGLLYGRATKAVGDELLKQGITTPSGTVSPDALNLMKKGGLIEGVETKLPKISGKWRTGKNPELPPKGKNTPLNRSIPERIRLRELTTKSKTETLTEAEIAEANKLRKTIEEANLSPEERLLLEEITKVKTPEQELEESLSRITGNIGDKLHAYGTSVIDPRGALEEVASRISTQEPTLPPIRQQPPPNVPPPSGPSSITPSRSPIEYANIPKATSASGDISFHGRQGLWMVRRPEWWQSWPSTIKSIKPENYRNFQRELINDPKFNEAMENGLSLTDFSHESLKDRGLSKEIIDRLIKQEEQFASRVAEKITGGKYGIVSTSNRVWSTAANYIRFHSYKSITNNIDKLAARGKLGGIDPTVIKKNIADYLNTGTGRGSMGLRIGKSSETLEKAADLLNTVLWSPRNQASLVQLINPLSYTRLDPFTRKEALKDAIGFVTAGSGLLGAAKLGGAEVDLNPTSPDFLKAKWGKVRVDMSRGFASLIRFIAQSIDGVANISGSNVQGPDPLRFLRSKLSPAASSLVDQQQGRDYLGNRVKTIEERSKNILSKFLPLVIQDLWEVAQEDPELLPIAGPAAILGGSAQVHEN